MAITTAADILEDVRSIYLNDPSANEATDILLLKHLKLAHRILEGELQVNGVQTINEEATQVVPANSSEIYPLPSDLAIPKALYERASGTSEGWSPMLYRNTINQVTAGSVLQFWTYRVDRIFVVAATQDREVKLEFQRSYPVPETTDAVLIGKAETFLAAKTAASYSLFVRQNPTIAQQANDIAEAELQDIIRQQVQLMQASPTRRKGYMPNRSS